MRSPDGLESSLTRFLQICFSHSFCSSVTYDVLPQLCGVGVASYSLVTCWLSSWENKSCNRVCPARQPEPTGSYRSGMPVTSLLRDAELTTSNRLRSLVLFTRVITDSGERNLSVGYYSGARRRGLFFLISRPGPARRMFSRPPRLPVHLTCVSLGWQVVVAPSWRRAFHTQSSRTLRNSEKA